jgi:phosphoribosyl-ATP pyrophosphohydrolase
MAKKMTKLKAAKPAAVKPAIKKAPPKQRAIIKAAVKTLAARRAVTAPGDVSAAVLDRLWSVVMDRRAADPAVSHSARLLSRGTAKVAQKFGEEAVECLIEAVAGNKPSLIAESADVLYHMLVLWVAVGVEPADVWAELERREGVSGVAEKAGRPVPAFAAGGTRKIP